MIEILTMLLTVSTILLLWMLNKQLEKENRELRNLLDRVFEVIRRGEDTCSNLKKEHEN